jgi:uncharacterized membrane protein YdjX (TVP38/TMEM64 family)
MKAKHRIGSYIILGILITALFVGSYFIPGIEKLTSINYLRGLLLSLGPWGHLTIIGLLIISIPLPIPSTPIILSGGYLYGTIIGTVLSLIAIFVGSSISFFLVRKFGQPLLEKLVSKHHIEHFNHIFKHRGLTAAFISYALPIFPSDCVSLILGLTKVRYRDFVLILILGHIPRFLILNSLGENFLSGFSWQTVIILVLALLLVLIALFKKILKKFFFKELHELENELKKDIKKIEKKI